MIQALAVRQSTHMK